MTKSKCKLFSVFKMLSLFFRLKIDVCSDIFADIYNDCLCTGNVAPLFISGG